MFVQVVASNSNPDMTISSSWGDVEAVVKPRRGNCKDALVGFGADGLPRDVLRPEIRRLFAKLKRPPSPKPDKSP